MLIRRITLENFMSHQSSEVLLPDKGVVLVTGKNGSGKSSLAEAISMAGWGKTLRGSSPWVAGKNGSVGIDFCLEKHDGTITRKNTKSGKATLDFTPCYAEYSTTTKAQAALCDLIGNFDTWRRCSIFSSQDASHFTLSTDSERKRLLENLLGLDRFDEALSNCRDDIKRVSKEMSLIERDIEIISSKILVKKEALRDNEVSLQKVATKPILQEPRKEIKKLEDTLSRDEKRHSLARRNREETQTAKADLSALLSSNRRMLTSIQDSICSKCGQKVDRKHAEDVKNSILEDNKKLELSLQKNHTLSEKALEDIRSLDSEISSTRKAISSKNLEIREAATYNSITNHIQGLIDTGTEEISKLEADKDAATKDTEKLRYSKSILENTETVLGTKGVRAHILISALKALEVTSNKWLRKISGGDISISISPYTAKKSGGNKEAIALNIHGIAGGEGYKAASGGQRRRIDVALLLALSELAQASEGSKGGTVFFDEVFDSLDSEGIASVSDVIDTMGKNKAVVIISHSEELASHLTTTLHYNVDSGIVS